MPRHARTPLARSTIGMPKAPIVMQTGPWTPETESVEVDAEHHVEVVTAQALEEWPVLHVEPGACLAQPMADGTTLQLRVIDQGRTCNRPGQMGRGVSIACPSGCHALAWKGQLAAVAESRLLSFVVVARVTATKSTPEARRAAQDAAIAACCQEHILTSHLPQHCDFFPFDTLLDDLAPNKDRVTSVESSPCLSSFMS